MAKNSRSVAQQSKQRRQWHEFPLTAELRRRLTTDVTNREGKDGAEVAFMNITQSGFALPPPQLGGNGSVALVLSIALQLTKKQDRRWITTVDFIEGYLIAAERAIPRRKKRRRC